MQIMKFLLSYAQMIPIIMKIILQKFEVICRELIITSRRSTKKKHMWYVVVYELY